MRLHQRVLRHYRVEVKMTENRNLNLTRPDETLLKSLITSLEQDKDNVVSYTVTPIYIQFDYPVVVGDSNVT